MLSFLIVILHLHMAIIQQNTTINCAGILIDLAQPKIMGVLNSTPDSFYDGGKFDSMQSAMDQVGSMIESGADFIDIGGMSSRPGAAILSVQEEMDRVLPYVKEIRSVFPDCLISIDTWRWEIAKNCVDAGASMINDISSGSLDPDLLPNLPSLNVPYVLMHMQGVPKNMQEQPTYENVSLEIFDFLSARIQTLKELGQKDIIIDPGFGFGKTVQHNYRLLKDLANFRILGCPILVGLSRKRMIHKLLEILPEQALNGTTAAHMLSLLNGANILRVHDVKEAKECVKIYETFQNC